jgi:hypothetical protein
MTEPVVADPSTAQAPSAAAGALSTVVDLSKVKGPEELPPSVAQELGEIVATHEGGWRDVLVKDGLKQLGVVGAFGLLALTGAMPVMRWAFFGAALSLPLGLMQTRRQAPYLMAIEHLKQLGVGWNARRRILKKLRQIAGTFPAAAPADRPPAVEIAALLEPKGDEMGRQTVLAAAPHADRLDQLPERTARVVVDQRLVFKRRVRWVVGLFVIIYGAVLGPLLVKASLGFVFVMAIALVLQLGLSVGLSLPLIRRQLRAPMLAVGLGKADAKLGLKALFAAEKKVRARAKATGDKLDREALVDALVEQWRGDLGAMPALTEGGDAAVVPDAPVPSAVADKASAA